MTEHGRWKARARVWLLAVALALGAGPLGADDAAQLCAEGAAAVRKGELVRAVDVYLRALDLADAPECAFLGVARAYRALGEGDAARLLLEEGSARYPRSLDIILELASALAAVERFDRAESCVARARDIEPESVPALVALARVQAARGELEKARATLESAVRLDSSSFAARHNLGLVTQRLGDLDTALELLRAAVKLNPDEARAHASLASCLRGLGRLEEAREALLVAVERDPNFAPAHYSLSRISLRLGRGEDGAVSMRRFRQLKARRHYQSGEVLRRKGDTAGAIRAYQRSLDSYPGLVNAHSSLGLLYLEAGDATSALRHSKRAAKLDPRGVRFANVALIYHLAGQRENAREWVEKAIAEEPDRRAFLELRQRILEDSPEGSP